MIPIVFALLASSVAAAPSPQTCKSQIIAVNKEWSLPLTTIAQYQFCTYTFKLPQNTFAIVDLQAQNTNYGYIQVSDDFGNRFLPIRESANTSSEHYVIPGNVQINIQTNKYTNDFQIQLKISVQKATPQANVVDRISTDLNGPSSVLYLNQWQEGSSYTVKSFNSKVNLKFVPIGDTFFNDLENIFIYESNAVVGTLNKQNFVSKTSQVTLYMAKKPRCTGAILVTDNSNVSPFFYHFAVFVPSSGYTEHLVSGSADLPGALTIVGKEDGSTPITVLELSHLDGGTGNFSVASGGPIADYAKTIAIGNNDLPMKLTGNVTTIYLSKQRGIVKFTA